MTNAIASAPQWATAHYQLKRRKQFQGLWFFTFLSLTGLTGLFFLATKPTIVPIAAIIGIAGLVVICRQPHLGLYGMLLFALAGDAVLMPAYPFVKNLSSIESLLYIHDSLIFSPLELMLVVMLVIWLVRAGLYRRLNFHAGTLFWPLMVFVIFLIYGLAYGIGTGGDVNIALWEARAIFYLPIMMVLVSNLIQNKEQVNQLIWAIMIGLLIEGLVGNFTFFVTLNRSLAGVEAMTEHSAAIHMNTLFVLVLAAWLFGASVWKRYLLICMIPPVALTYLATQRRSAFIALGVALALMLITTRRVNRQLFNYVLPTSIVIGTLYIGVFWNNNGALGLPAQAVKSIISPEAGSKDESSNLYRELENINISHTINSAPITGIGFGNKFIMFVQMPDLSSIFYWWEYIVHNSIFWIWLKTGLLGFIAMLFLIGFSIMTGIRTVWLIPPDGDLRAIILTATLYLIMHFLFAYVDISWDAQSMLYVGAMMGLINSIQRITGTSMTKPEKMDAWQTTSPTAAGLITGHSEEVSYG